MKTYKDIFANKKRVLFVTAHPDDIDVSFGGTLALLNLDKKETFVCVVTNGARGSRDNVVSEKELASARILEQRKALKILGLKKNNFITLNYKDGEVDNNMQLVGDLAGIIRTFHPDIICTHEPHEYYFASSRGGHAVNHRDHRMTGISVLDAVYPFSRDRSFFPHQLKGNAKTHAVYELIFTSARETNTQIDITKVVANKRKAMLQHKTQFDKEKVERILDHQKTGKKYFESHHHIKLSW